MRIVHSAGAWLLAAVLLVAVGCGSVSPAVRVGFAVVMDRYRVVHPACEACQRMPVEVHHILPVSQYPELAADTNNYISLCFKCHRCIGHPGGNTRHWNARVKETARTIREGRRTERPEYEP